MIERRIKELSIALEALSRINNPDINATFTNIVRLLDDRVGKAWTEGEPLRAITATSDDEIPF